MTAESIARVKARHDELAAAEPLKTRLQSYPLADANRALGDLRDGRLDGAAVLAP